MARIKAASIINNIELARELLGARRLDELVAALPPDTQALFARRLFAVEWLQADHWLPFQGAMLAEHFHGDEAAFRGYARKVCELDFNTFYKVIIRFLISPESLLERTGKLWSTYSDEGTLDVERGAPVDGHARVTLKLTGFRTRHDVFGVLLHAFIEQLLRMAGARDIDVDRRVNRVVDGALETELVASYR